LQFFRNGRPENSGGEAAKLKRRRKLKVSTNRKYERICFCEKICFTFSVDPFTIVLAYFQRAK
jgi:hypothetical protein